MPPAMLFHLTFDRTLAGMRRCDNQQYSAHPIHRDFWVWLYGIYQAHAIGLASV